MAAMPWRIVVLDHMDRHVADCRTDEQGRLAWRGDALPAVLLHVLDAELALLHQVEHSNGQKQEGSAL